MPSSHASHYDSHVERKRSSFNFSSCLNAAFLLVSLVSLGFFVYFIILMNRLIVCGPSIGGYGGYNSGVFGQQCVVRTTSGFGQASFGGGFAGGIGPGFGGPGFIGPAPGFGRPGISVGAGFSFLEGGNKKASTPVNQQQALFPAIKNA